MQLQCFIVYCSFCQSDGHMVEQVLEDRALLQLFTEVSGKDEVKKVKDDDATLVIQKLTNAIINIV